MTDPKNNELLIKIPVKFKKPPRRILGFTFCDHVWKKYWKKINEDVSAEINKCARCLKEQNYDK